MIRLDQRDAYSLSFDATLSAQRADPESAARSWVALSASAFYPTSGGQPCDHGTLNGVLVDDVVVDQGVVWHRTAAAPEVWQLGASVRGEVDGERRARHRQRHTAQHILSQALLRTDAAFTTEAVSLSSADLTIDVAGEPDAAALERAEALANEVAYQALPIVAFEVDEGNLADYPLRRPPKVQGRIRLVAIGEQVESDPASAWELSACGGTHVRCSAETAPITLLRSERIRGGLTRLTLRAGLEAWADHRFKHQVVSRSAASLSVGVPELAEKVAAVMAEVSEGRRALATLRATLARQQAESLIEAAGGEGALVVAELAEGEAELLTPLADALAELGGTAILGVVSAGTASLVITSGAGVDVRQALQAALPHIAGRGGGRPERAQGAGTEVSGLAAALAAAHHKVTDNSE
jgi:alanyl-tRNA synthetase